MCIRTQMNLCVGFFYKSPICIIPPRFILLNSSKKQAKSNLYFNGQGRLYPGPSPMVWLFSTPRSNPRVSQVRSQRYRQGIPQVPKWRIERPWRVPGTTCRTPPLPAAEADLYCSGKHFHR